MLFIFYLCIRRPSFEVETLAFFSAPWAWRHCLPLPLGEIKKQLLAVILGIGVFLAVGGFRDLERPSGSGIWPAWQAWACCYFRYSVREILRCQNWLYIGSLSVQPSELSKVCFILLGASTMDRLMNKRNLILFIGYSAFICGCLALMNDFGTALIFFCAFLVIAFLRSGSVGTVALAIAALVFAGVVALKIAPMPCGGSPAGGISGEDPLDTGYQQTRALMCLHSGGLLGLGAGRGWMVNVFCGGFRHGLCDHFRGMGSADGHYGGAVRGDSGPVQRPQYRRQPQQLYTIGSCTAASILLVQTMLNVLGTVDAAPDRRDPSLCFQRRQQYALRVGLLAFVKGGGYPAERQLLPCGYLPRRRTAMNRIASRSWVVFLIALLLVAGLTFFVAEFLTEGGDWATFTGSPSYLRLREGRSSVVDRNGRLCWTFPAGTGVQRFPCSPAGHPPLGGGDRRLHQHALYDYYALALSGYDSLNGVYRYGENKPVMTLTLDGDVERAALEAMDGRKGTIAVYNYKTGELLCAISTPHL